MIKAIETKYKGYRFRSRLEARWAVFFDVLGLDWEYEKEGYDLGEAGWYLPDFWIWSNRLTGEGQWIEIKAHRNLSTREFAVALALSKHSPGSILLGVPTLPVFHGQLSGATPPQLPFWAVATSNGGIMASNEELYDGSWALPFSKPLDDLSLDQSIATITTRMSCFHENLTTGDFYLWPVPAFEPVLLSTHDTGCPLKAGTKSINSKRLAEAYEKARSARFEHGEQPSI